LGHNHDDHDHEHYYDDSILHDNQYVFLKHYINMLQTCEVGLQYILSDFKKGNKDIQMLKDCIVAIKAIQDANFLAWNLMKKINQTAFESIRSFDKVMPYIEEIDEVDEKDLILSYEILEKGLLPEYLQWSSTVRNNLKQYTTK